MDKIISTTDNIIITTMYHPSLITQNTNIKPFVTKVCVFT